MHWRLKGAVQRVLGVLPLGDVIHLELQRRVGGLRHFERELAAKIGDLTLMLGHLRRAAQIEIAGTRFLEIGTGWYPTFPCGLALAGARSVITMDLHRHLHPDLVRQLVDGLPAYLPVIADAAGVELGAVEERHARLAAAVRRGASLDDATDGVIDYRAPGDASATQLPDASLDVVFSNSVLEHVPPPAIERCFAEARRILRRGGVMFHSVNCGDHYAYVDPSIHQLNYLQYSEAEWRKWNNRFLYQNRLRAIDFIEMARRARFAIELDTSRPHPTRLVQLGSIRVDPWFGRYTRDQLAITSIDFIGRRTLDG